MTKHPYDETRQPPAPMIKVVVEVQKHIRPRKKRREAKVTMSMILDTGAEISCIPNSLVRQLEKKLGGGLPYGVEEVKYINGKSYIHQIIYGLALSTPQEKHFKERKIDLLAVDSNVGILGRDVLNNYEICFDGKNWTCSARVDVKDK